MALVERLRGFLVIAAVVTALDQASKALVRDRLALGETWLHGWGLIRLSHVENTGAAFGILQGAGDLLIVTTLIAVGALAFFLLTLPSRSRLYPLALSLILGGAVGNLIDRVRYGSVTDFIDPTHYPAFNLADSAIVIGVVALFVLSWFEGDSSQREASNAPASAPAAATTGTERHE